MLPHHPRTRVVTFATCYPSKPCHRLWRPQPPAPHTRVCQPCLSFASDDLVSRIIFTSSEVLMRHHHGCHGLPIQGSRLCVHCYRKNISAFNWPHRKHNTFQNHLDKCQLSKARSKQMSINHVNYRGFHLKS